MSASLKYSIDIESIYWFYNFDSFFSEYHDWVVNTPASYSEGPSSNLGLETGYPDWGFSWIYVVTPGKFQDITSN